jgi:hypothetical protein
MSWYDDWLKKRIMDDVGDLLKADADKLPNQPQLDESPSEQIGRKAIIDDPYFEHLSQSVVFRHRMSRLSNKTLKDVSVRDWVCSVIIQNRCDTLTRYSRVSHDIFKPGFRFVTRDPRAKMTPQDEENIRNLEDFIYHCGRTKNVPEDDRMLFGQFLKMTVRDALTFGHIAVEKIKTRRKGLHRIRPLPAESVYLINKRASREMIERELKSAKTIYRNYSTDNDPRAKQQVNEVDIDYFKYIQTSYDNRTLAVFGDEDMVFKLFNPQNFADSNGYCYSLLELAIINITNHLNVENYNSNFFTHGQASRGILHLKGTVTQSQMHSFRRMFYNNISGAQHAWKTPIIAGLEEVQWVPLAGNAREMEYINFNNHILRAICSQFQIDPLEIGLDYLISPTGRAMSGQKSQSEKIEFSRERGFEPILMFFEDFINCDIVPSIDPELAAKYKFEFVGYGDETPQTQVAQLQAEMTVHSSMNDLLRAAQKECLNIEGADLPLNQAYWMMIEKNMTKGEIREKFFGDKDAAKKRELQYFPADPAFMGWQQLLLTIDRQKKQDEMMKQQMEAQAKTQEVETKHAEGEHQREEEKHKMEQEQMKNAGAHAAVGESLKQSAKAVGAAAKPLSIGGQSVANPINKEDE